MVININRDGVPLQCQRALSSSNHQDSWRETAAMQTAVSHPAFSYSNLIECMIMAGCYADLVRDLQGCGCGKREGGQSCERDGISISQGLHIYSIKDWSSVWICTVQLLLSNYQFCPRLSVSVLPSPRTRSWLLPTKHSTPWRKRPATSECIVDEDMFVVLKYGFTCCKPWCVIFQYSGKDVIVGILKTGQKNLFLCVNIRYVAILIYHTVVMFNTLSPSPSPSLL